MELWMLEKSTIYALMDASQSRVGFSDESIDAAFRVRSRRKHLELAQLAFYGSLELHVFSDFDIRGEESLLSLQNRWAKDYSPHDLPFETSLGHLVDLFKENAAGRSVAYYRYLWCEAQSVAVFQALKDQHGQLSATEMQRQVRQQLMTEGVSEWRNTDALFAKYNL
jgi:Zn-dependent oligopeptidase